MPQSTFKIPFAIKKKLGFPNPSFLPKSSPKARKELVWCAVERKKFLQKTYADKVSA